VQRNSSSRLPALAVVVQDAVGEHGLTFRQFADRAIDPETGYQMSSALVHSISQGSDFKVSPRVLRALAAGAGTPLLVVQLAAIRQFIGLDLDLPHLDRRVA